MVTPGALVQFESGGEDSHLRRENPPDLQSGAIDYSATSGIVIILDSDIIC